MATRHLGLGASVHLRLADSADQSRLPGLQGPGRRSADFPGIHGRGIRFCIWAGHIQDALLCLQGKSTHTQGSFVHCFLSFHQLYFGMILQSVAKVLGHFAKFWNLLDKLRTKAKKMPFAKLTPAPLIKVYHSSRHYGSFRVWTTLCTVEVAVGFHVFLMTTIA